MSKKEPAEQTQEHPVSKHNEGGKSSTSVRTGILSWFAANPIVGGIAALCSIISIPLAFYLYFSAERVRLLTMYVHPIRTAVVKTGHTSALRVLFNNQEIKSDVNAVQIAFWNDGNDPIRPEHILDGIKIQTSPAVPILEAIVRKTSRPVAGVRLDHSRISEGKLGLDWRILEGDDGAVIQIVYAGTPETQISLHGTIEGQKQLVVTTALNTGKPEEPPKPPRETLLRLLMMATLPVTVMFIVRRLIQITSSRFKVFVWFNAALIVCAILSVIGVLGYYIIADVTRPYPPFGF